MFLYIISFEIAWLHAWTNTVQLRGNVALACYSTLESRDLDTLYSCSDAPDVSASRVINHSRTHSLEKYLRFLVQVEYYIHLTRVLYQMIHNSNRENEEPRPFVYLTLDGGFEWSTAFKMHLIIKNVHYGLTLLLTCSFYDALWLRKAMPTKYIDFPRLSLPYKRKGNT